MEGESSDDELMQRLEAATIAVLRSERPAILHNRQRLASVTVELSVLNNGAIIEGDVYTHRRGSIERLVEKCAPVPAEKGA